MVRPPGAEDPQNRILYQSHRHFRTTSLVRSSVPDLEKSKLNPLYQYYANYYSTQRT
jgi:hypothetical protein